GVEEYSALTHRKTAVPAAMGFCVLFSALTVTGCGSGSSSGSGTTTPPTSGGGAPSGPSLPSGPAGGSQPQLFIEHDPDGTPFLRVQEQAIDVFGASVQRVIADKV